MTSKARTKRASQNPPPAVESPINERSKVKRQATVYDAVAGRISAAGFIRDRPFISSTRDTPSSSSAAVSPEAVLFRRKNAPIRYEESDFYFASDSLPPEALPDSDLLKALHCYTSDFYSRATTDGGSGDWRSLDETALLALGILMEELCRERLGDAGDMVFTEAEVNDETLDHKEFGKTEHCVVNTSEAAVKSGRTRSRKRRRLSLEG